MTFNPVTSPVDYILLANRRSPGLATVAAANSPRRIDIRRGYALSGSRPVFRGIGLASPVVTLRLYASEDWDNWHEWRELVQRPPRGERPRAQDIWHPILEDQGIASVLVQDVGQPIQTSDGEWSIIIKFVEFRRPVRAIAVPDGSDDTAVDPVEQRIDNLTARFNALATSDTEA